jgi:hypothetical protein
MVTLLAELTVNLLRRPATPDMREYPGPQRRALPQLDQTATPDATDAHSPQDTHRTLRLPRYCVKSPAIVSKLHDQDPGRSSAGSRPSTFGYEVRCAPSHSTDYISVPSPPSIYVRGVVLQIGIRQLRNSGRLIHAPSCSRLSPLFDVRFVFSPIVHAAAENARHSCPASTSLDSRTDRAQQAPRQSVRNTAC